MSNNPTATLARPAIAFCLARKPKTTDLICTRIDNHLGHCCDETAGEAWTDRGAAHECGQGHDHRAEKNLAGRD